MQGGTVSGNTAGGDGGGVYAVETFTKTGGTLYGGNDADSVKNTAASRQGHAVYQQSGPQWRSVTAGPAMNHDVYGFWLND
jgi:predicted outer membrane repeat protein